MIGVVAVYLHAECEELTRWVVVGANTPALDLALIDSPIGLPAEPGPAAAARCAARQHCQPARAHLRVVRVLCLSGLFVISTGQVTHHCGLWLLFCSTPTVNKLVGRPGCLACHVYASRWMLFLTIGAW